MAAAPPPDIFHTNGLPFGNSRVEYFVGDETNISGTWDVLVAQFISPPLEGAQTIDGTVKGQIRAVEQSTGPNDFRAQFGVRVFSGDGLTLRGTAVALDASALSSEFDSGSISLDGNYENRKFPLAAVSPVTLSSVSASDGDRIVVEIGARAHNVSTDNAIFALALHPDASSDLAEDETSNPQLRAWVEFSDTFTFEEPTVRITHVHVEAALSAGDPTIRVTNVIAEAAMEEYWHGWDIQLRDGDWGGDPPTQPGARGADYRNSGDYRDAKGYTVA
jgi:hypothetical protein